MELDDIIFKFKLDTLDSYWVSCIWENEFLDVEEISASYMDLKEFDSAVLELMAELKNIMASSTSNHNEAVKIWDCLGSQVKYLLPALCNFIKHGNIDSEEYDKMITAIDSAGLYFLLLSIPGSSAYKVFRNVLYEYSLDTFKISSLVRNDKANRKNKNDDMLDEEDDSPELFHGEKYELAQGLNRSLSAMISLLKSNTLKDKTESFDSTLEIMIGLLYIDCKISRYNFTDCRSSVSNPSSYKNLEELLHSLSYNAYVALSVMAKGRLQESDIPCIEMILDNLLPGLAWGGSYGSPRERSVMRQNVISFVKQCLLPIAKEDNILEDTVLTLVRHLCGVGARMPTDVRRNVSSTVLEIVDEMPNVLPVLNWIEKFSGSEKGNHRLMSVEILNQMLHKSKDTEKLRKAFPQIMKVLLGRLRDISPAVCGRALTSISDSCMHTFVLDYLQSSFREDTNQEEDDDSEPRVTQGEILLMDLIERATDIRAMVRRSSLQLLASIITIIPLEFRQPVLSVLREHCLDPSSMVRKQVLISLTNVICTIPSGEPVSYIEDVEESWLRGVLPQVCDRDPKVREKTLELSFKVLLCDEEGRISSPNWRLIQQIETQRQLPFLSEACFSWAKNLDSFVKCLWCAISEQLEGQNQYLAWLFLSIISEHAELPDAAFIMRKFIDFSEKTTELNVVEEATYIHILRVLGRVSIDLLHDDVKQIESRLLDRVSRFLLPASVIRPAIDALYLISRQAADIPFSDYTSFVPAWGPKVIQSCEEYLVSSLQSNAGGRGCSGRGRGGRRRQQEDSQRMDPNEEDELVKRLLTMADVSLICPGIIGSSTVTSIQSILFPESFPNAKMVSRSRTPKLCAVSVVVLGKLCLQDARLAARIVPSLGVLLQQPPAIHPTPPDSAWAPLRNNIMCALSDMCRSFAQLVDPLLPRMSACLRSTDATLKENALVLLVQLLQEDYLKVRRGALLFDLLTALNDKEIAVRQLASYYLSRCLVHNQPSIMSQNILPALFHYNGYKGHEIYKVYGVEANNTAESISENTDDETETEDRRNIFRFMLQHITDDHRPKVITKLCREIFGGVVEGTISLDLVEGCQLLSDAIWMLTCDEIRASGLKGSGEDDGDEEAAGGDETAIEAAAAAAAAAAVAGPSSSAAEESGEQEPPSKKRKNQPPNLQKEMLDVLLPIAVALMQKLEQLESPLLSHLMGFLFHTLKEYKIDVGDLAAGDKKMLDDLSRNLKPFERK